MGVIGLTSLIEVNPHLLNEIKLRDMDLVVDGNSFCYQVYNSGRIDSRFGGDYPRYEAIINDRLSQFQSCNIRPIFVFDGLLDVQTLKYETALVRQKTRLYTAKSVSSGSREKLLPLFAQIVLIDVLKTRRIELYQCSGEADAIAAGLANSRRAPLLSQDSDFFIFDLKFGYIAFETLEWADERSKGESSSHLSAKLYVLDNLLSHYPTVDRRLLPLFAFLCGNDFSAGCNLSKFFDHIHKPRVDIAGGQREASSKKRRSTKGIRPMRRHCNMIAVLEWLCGKTDEGKTVEEALQFIELKRREKIRRVLQRSMDAYRRCGDSDDPDSENCFDIISIVRNHICHLDSPEWLLDEYIKADVPVGLLYLRQDGRIFLPTLIEDFSNPSVYNCCRILRIAVYRILLAPDESGQRMVTEYSRNRLHFAKCQFDIDEDDPDSPSLPALPKLENVEKVSVEDRRQLYQQCFQLSSSDLDVLSNFPSPLTPFVASFIFWCQSKDTDVKRCQAAALFFCMFYLVRRRREEGEDDSDWPTLSTVEQLPMVELEFDYSPNLSNKRGNSLEVCHLHSFSQWQACFQAGQWLETVLARPFGPTIPVQLIFHGRMLYNLAVFFENSKSEAAAWDYLLQNSPLFGDIFNEIWSIVEKYAPVRAVGGRGKGKAKRKNRAKKTEGKVEKDDLGETISSDEKNSANLESSDDEWALENRFRTLVRLK